MTETRTHRPVADFDGYLLLFVLAGEGPGVWVVRPTPDATCEECGREPDGQVRMYRTLALGEAQRYDPQLGFCHGCLQRTWDDRPGDREVPDPSGAFPHMYAPLP